MSEPVHDQRYAPPQAHVEDVPAATGGFTLAGRGARLGASLIDFVIAAAGLWAVSLVSGWSPWAAAAEGRKWLAVGMNFVLGFLLFVAINGYLLVRHGQTVGKKALGIRIVRPDGSPASAARLLGLRYALAYYALSMVPTLGQVYALVDMLAIFQSSRRCLHDLIAGTIVIQA